VSVYLFRAKVEAESGQHHWSSGLGISVWRANNGSGNGLARARGISSGTTETEYGYNDLDQLEWETTGSLEESDILRVSEGDREFDDRVPV